MNRHKVDEFIEARHTRDLDTEDTGEVYHFLHLRIGYYVYGILVDKQLVYIGKGTGGRVLKSMDEHGGNDYMIFMSGMTDRQAYRYEKQLIKLYSRMGFYLDNKVY